MSFDPHGKRATVEDGLTALARAMVEHRKAVSTRSEQAVFMLGGGYAFLRNAHVRIDFISNKFGARGRNWVDVVGIVVFLFPLCWMMGTLGWPTFVQAWVSGEMSSNAGGLIRWPVYALMPLGFALLLLQALSELLKRVLFLRGLGPDSLADADHKSEEQKHIEELEAIAARKLAGEK